MVENVIQIKSEIVTNVDVSVKTQKNIVCAKKIIFEILLHIAVKMVNIWQVLLTNQGLHVRKLLQKQKQFQQILMTKNNL